MNKKYIIISFILTFIVTGLTIYSLLLGNEYTIKFNSNGGTIIDNKIVKVGNKIKLPKAPVKEGYIFIEWRYKDKIVDNNTKIYKNMILDAVWAKIGEYGDYKVSFDANGGSEVTGQLILKGKTAIKPTDPTKKGYKFIGWYLDKKEYDFNTPINDNITLVAKYEKQD